MTVGRVEAHRVAGDVRTAVVGGRRPVGGDGVLARCRREVGRCTRGAHHRSHTRGLGGGGCVGGELGDGHDRDDVIDTGGDPGEGVGERRCIDIDTGGRVETHGVGRDVRATISSRRCPLDLDRPLTRRRRKIRRRTRRDDLGRRVSEFGCRRRVCRELRLRDHRHRMIDTRRDTGELIRERRRIHVMTIRRIETHRVAGDIGTAISGRSRPRDRDRTIARNGERTRRCVRSDDEGAHRRRLSGDRRVSRELRGGRDRHRMIDTRRDTGELIRERRRIDVMAVDGVETHGVPGDVRTAIGSGRHPFHRDRTIAAGRQETGRCTRGDDERARRRRLSGDRRISRELRGGRDRHRMIDTRRDTGELIRERRRIHVMTIRRIETDGVARDVRTAIGSGRGPRHGDRTIARRGRQIGGCTRCHDRGGHTARLSSLGCIGRELGGRDDRHGMTHTGGHGVERVSGGRRIDIDTGRGIDAHRVTGDFGTTVGGRGRPVDLDRALTRCGRQTGGCIRRHHEGAQPGELDGGRRVGREFGRCSHRDRVIDTGRDAGEGGRERRGTDVMAVGGVETHAIPADVRAAIGGRRGPVDLERTLARRGDR